jgi:hypothetical protein
MELINAIKSGYRLSFSNKRLIFFLYLLNLIFAVIITIPFRNVLNNSLSHSLAMEKIIDRFNFTVLFDFINKFGSNLNIIFDLILWIGLIFLIFNVFLTGGILSIWKTESKKFDRKIFLSDCLVYFYKFIKLLLLFLVLAFITFLFYLIIMFLMLNIAESFDSNNITIISQIIAFGIFTIMIMIDLVIYDYARIIIVKEIAEKSFKAMVESFKFVMKNIFRTLGIVLFLLIIFLIITLIYLLFRQVLSNNTTLLIILVFIIQQLYIILRIGLRVFSFASQYRYYEEKQSR